METVISALIVMGVLVLTILGLAQYSLSAQAQITDASRMMQERLGERARTNLQAVSGVTDVTGAYAFITLKNNGSTKLADFTQWDVIVQHVASGATYVRWYPYSMGTSQWSKTIYASVAPNVAEVIEPGILNPGEYIILTIGALTPAISVGTTNLATISTPNGIVATTVFTR